MPSISNMIGLISKLDGAYVTVHQERCVLVRNRNSDCLRCAQVCTSGCISYDNEQLTIDPSNCTLCGTCASNCPTCALEAHFPNDAELMARCTKAAQAGERKVCIACGSLLDCVGDACDPDAVVRVECLGRVEESLLTALASNGVSQVILVHGSCGDCNHATGREMVERVIDTQEQLMDAWNCSMTVRLAAKFPAYTHAAEDKRGKRKRNDLQQSGNEALRMGATTAEFAVSNALGSNQQDQKSEPVVMKVMEDGTLPHFLPDRRERLLDALAGLGQPQDVMIDTRLWGHVIIDADTCSSCLMCSTFCPTGALSRFKDADGTFGVEHYPGDCVKCRCCENICPEGAISISEEVFAVDMLAGMVERYPMAPVAVQRGAAHTIWHMAEDMMLTDQVFER